MRRKLLIVCDSHGAGYGTTGFVKRMAEKLDQRWEIDRREYGGITVDRIIEKLQDDGLGNYDLGIIQVGNPDVHPRMPIKPLRFLRSLGMSFMRDSLFSVPPNFSLRYFLRWPLFLIRMVVLRFHQEFIFSEKELTEAMRKLIALVDKKCDRMAVLPIFEVSARLYTDSHRRRARRVNEIIRSEFDQAFYQSAILEPEYMRQYYNHDGFHYVAEYHQILCDDLIKESVARAENRKNKDRIVELAVE